MRSVSKFKLVQVDADERLFQAVCDCLCEWFQSKFVEADDGTIRIRKDGRPAVALSSLEEVAGSKIFRMQATEEVSGGKLTTSTAVLIQGDEVRFACDLGLVATGAARPNIALRAPRFIQSVVGLGGAWHVEQGRDRVFSQAFKVKETAGELIDLLTWPNRALPVIVISERDGAEAFPSLAADVAKRLTSLAHVCVLDEAGSWSLTQALGREWSCYNGAVRLYWPGAVPIGSPFRNPLWFAERLEARFNDAAEEWLCNKLTRLVIDASSYLSVDPAFEQVEEQISERRIREAELRAQENSDYAELARIYADENGGLKRRAKALQLEIENLKAEVEGFRAAYIRGDSISVAVEEAATELPPASVEEAVSQARHRFGDNIAFPDDLDAQLATLNPQAGPPSKVLEHLSGLAELATNLAGSTSIGMSVPKWLKARNIECSGESETVRKSKSAREERTFLIGGERVYCEYHTKPSDGTSPDRCVRIYFDKADEGRRVRVGYIGRHF